MEIYAGFFSVHVWPLRSAPASNFLEARKNNNKNVRKIIMKFSFPISFPPCDRGVIIVLISVLFLIQKKKKKDFNSILID